MCCWSEETALPRASSSHSTARFDETRFLGVKGVDADGVNDADESEYSPDSEGLGDDGSGDDAVSELSPSVDDNTEGEETSTQEDDASVPDTDGDGDGDDHGVAQESDGEFDCEVGVNDDEEGGALRFEADSAFPEPMRRHPHRTRKPPARMMTPETAQYDVPRVADPMRNLVVTTSDDSSVKEATGASLEERDLRLEAMLNECNSKDAKGTRMPAVVAETAPSPTHIILKIKRYPDGVADQFKARIVASRNHHVYDYDYTAAYAPVIDFTLLRVVLYIALSLQTYMAQGDVKTAFLNRNLKESVCVTSPRGVDNHPSRMYKLTKALCGLEQAHLAWHTRLCADLVSMGSTALPSAPCVFIRRTGSGIVFILVYVDDLGIFSSSRQVLEDVVKCLAKLYELRVSHGMTPFLRVQIDWSTLGDARRMSMSQPGYVLSVLRRFQMHDSKPVGTPMIPGFFAALAKETRTGDQVVDLEQYQPMIGCLLYLGRRTRPDTLAPVRILARFCKVADVVLPQGRQADPAIPPWRLEP
jgi:hypothetical protein